MAIPLSLRWSVARLFTIKGRRRVPGLAFIGRKESRGSAPQRGVGGDAALILFDRLNRNVAVCRRAPRRIAVAGRAGFSASDQTGEKWSMDFTSRYPRNRPACLAPRAPC